MKEIPFVEPLVGIAKKDRPSWMGFSGDHNPDDALLAFFENYGVEGTLYRGNGGVLLCGPIPKHLLYTGD